METKFFTESELANLPKWCCDKIVRLENDLRRAADDLRAMANTRKSGAFNAQSILNPDCFINIPDRFTVQCPAEKISFRFNADDRIIVMAEHGILNITPYSTNMIHLKSINR